LRPRLARHCAGWQRGRPVRQGRAPLRPVAADRGVAPQQVVPSAKDGLHCGGLLRRGRVKSRRVVPSAKDGLHCGFGAGTSSTHRIACRPVRQGRAPLRRAWASRRTRGRWRRPVRQGRAPLRHDRGLPGPAGWRGVVPSAKDGLHCGPIRDIRPSCGMKVVPSAKDGLHCGKTPAGYKSADSLSRPVRQGRAPLRRARTR